MPWLGHALARCTVVIVLAACVSAAALGHTASVDREQAVLSALERYGRGEFEQAVEDLTRGPRVRSSIRAFRRASEDWIAAGGPSAPARLALASTLALEVVARGLQGAFTLEDWWYEVRGLVEWACGLLRRGPPSPFERVFHLASIALLQGARDNGILVGARTSPLGEPSPPHILHAADRFPGESRFRLAWMVSREEVQLIGSWPLAPGYLVTQGAGRFRADFPGTTDRLEETIAKLGQLADDREVGSEARLRRGVLRFVSGDPLGAVPDVRAAAESTDQFVRYLAHVMMGLAEEENDHLEDAIEQYEHARRVVPATAATLALASALFRAGRSDEAAGVLSIWSRSPRPDDPWRLYGNGDFRRFPAYLTQMREYVLR